MSADAFRIGISIPNNWGVDDPLSLVELAAEAEEAGFDSIWLSEHIFNMSYVEKRIGDRPYYHPLALLAFIAARTRAITLGTSVLVLPFHYPAELAKFAATLDRLAPGRLVLGVGAGAIAEEFAALGLSFADRGSRTSESLAVIRKLLAPGPATHHGDLWHFDDVIFSPKPRSPGDIPFWVGGGASMPVYRRAALLSDGWHATGMTREAYRAGIEAVRHIAAGAGRDPSELTFSMRVNVDYGEPLPSPAEEKTRISSADPVRMAEEILAWRSAGAQHLILALNVSQFAHLRAEVRRIGREVLPRLRLSGRLA